MSSVYFFYIFIKVVMDMLNTDALLQSLFSLP